MYLGNDIPYTVYTVCLGSHVSTLTIFPPPLESQWIFFLPLACSFLLMECNSWVAFATLLMKIAPIFQNSIKTPFSRKPITSLCKHRCIHITMEAILFCLFIFKIGKNIFNRNLHKSVLDMSESGEENQVMFPIPHGL